MPNNNKKTPLSFLISLSVFFNVLVLFPVHIKAQIPTTNDTASQQPPPQPRAGMSAYAPANYADSVSVNQTITKNSPKGQGLPGSEPSQSPVRPYNGPSVTIPGTGIKGYFNAPVPPPYNGSASYDTYAGQPGGNRDAILQQSVDR